MRYIQKHFMQRCGALPGNTANYEIPRMVCDMGSLSGFPAIRLSNDIGDIFEFTPNDYFAFPTHVAATSPTGALFGFNMDDSP